MPTCALGSLAPALLQPLPALLLGLPTSLPQSALRLAGALLDLALKLRRQSNGAASPDVLLLHILQRQSAQQLAQREAEKVAAVGLLEQNLSWRAALSTWVRVLLL